MQATDRTHSLSWAWPQGKQQNWHGGKNWAKLSPSTVYWDFFYQTFFWHFKARNALGVIKMNDFLNFLQKLNEILETNKQDAVKELGR